MEYLCKLAQYRLASKVVMEINHFLRGAELIMCTPYSISIIGLHCFVPDDLLGMFDENELEVMIIIIIVLC